MAGKTKTLKAWVVLDREGRLVRWIGAVPTRDAAWKAAAPGMMGSTDYEMMTDEGRKNQLKREGVRVVRATVTVDNLKDNENR